MQEAGVFLKDAHWADPDGVDVKFFVHNAHAFGKSADGDEHILDNVVQFVELAELLGLQPLHDGNVGGHGPAEQVAENRVVSERDNVLDLPEQTARMPVVVVAERDVFDASAAVQVFLDVREEPWLPVVADGVDQAWLGGFDHISFHNDPVVGRVYERLDKIDAGVVERFFAGLHGGLFVADRLVLHPHPRLGLDDLNFNPDKEPECAVAPRDGPEEFRVFGGRAALYFALGSDNLESDARVREQAILVGGGFDANPAA